MALAGSVYPLGPPRVSYLPYPDGVTWKILPQTRGGARAAVFACTLWYFKGQRQITRVGLSGGSQGEALLTPVLMQ